MQDAEVGGATAKMVVESESKPRWTNIPGGVGWCRGEGQRGWRAGVWLDRDGWRCRLCVEYE